MTKIGEILVNEDFISAAKLNEALKKKHLYPRVMIGDLLVLMGCLTTDKLHRALEIQRKDNINAPLQEKPAIPTIDNTSLHNSGKTLSALIELLIKKEIFTRDELMEMMNQK
ncbi:MAG: hypothetical protein ACUZ8E_09125 [Candidatus Anammoxibacter sp.]